MNRLNGLVWFLLLLSLLSLLRRSVNNVEWSQMLHLDCGPSGNFMSCLPSCAYYLGACTDQGCTIAWSIYKHACGNRQPDLYQATVAIACTITRRIPGDLSSFRSAGTMTAHPPLMSILPLYSSALSGYSSYCLHDYSPYTGRFILLQVSRNHDGSSSTHVYIATV